MTSRPSTNDWLSLLAWIALVATAAAIGTIASLDAADFYSRLRRPDWAPPSSVFGPVWTLLYIAMAIAAWLVWKVRDTTLARVGLSLFVAQLALNALWSWLFFAWHRGALAFADILVLCVLVGATVVVFWRVRPMAGALLVPYFVWLLFAAALNFAVWTRNPDLLG